MKEPICTPGLLRGRWRDAACTRQRPPFAAFKIWSSLRSSDIRVTTFGFEFQGQARSVRRSLTRLWPGMEENRNAKVCALRLKRFRVKGHKRHASTSQSLVFSFKMGNTTEGQEHKLQP